MREGDEKDAHEDKHLDEAEPLQLAQDHGPRVEEDRLDVENDEQHRRQVEAHRQAAVGGGVGDDPGLVWGHLAFRRARWAEHEAQGNERYHEPEDDQDEDEQWDVALEQVSEAASGMGAFGNSLNSIGALRNAVEPPLSVCLYAYARSSFRATASRESDSSDCRPGRSPCRRSPCRAYRPTRSQT